MNRSKSIALLAGAVVASVTCLSLLFPSTGYATKMEKKNVGRITVAGDAFYVYLVPPTSKTICPAISPDNDQQIRYFIINDNSPQSNAMINLVLTAKAQGLVATIVGSDNLADCKERGGEHVIEIEIR